MTTSEPKMLMSRPSPSDHSRRGFTLVEMMISVALVLILMLAVTKIFSITGAAVGAAQGMGAATRDARAAQTVFVRDLASLANDSPFIIIQGNIQPAFRSKVDEQTDTTYSASTTPNASTYAASDAGLSTIRSIDFTGSGAVDYGPLTVNVRNHRQDIFTFCARDRFYRQTGNTGTLVSTTSSPEAWIWYGHLVMPDGSGLFNYATPLTPGDNAAATNPNNFYASQWTLGRVATLLIDSSTLAKNYIQRNQPNVPVASPFSPFAFGVSTGTLAGLSGTSPAWASVSTTDSLETPTSSPLVSSRFDIANTSISLAKSDLSTIEKTTPTWFLQLLYQDWAGAPPNVPARFDANSFVTKPLSSSVVAKQVPIFLPSCSQFIVEYAGDFVSQDDDSTDLANYGKVTNTVSDGTLDYVVDPTTHVRSIRWYGLPRNTTTGPGDGSINAARGDVVTVSDFASGNFAAGSTATPVASYASTPYAFEHVMPRLSTDPTPTPTTAYAAPSGSPPTPKSFIYTAAWGPETATSATNSSTNRPKMYRITLVIDRPEMAGRTQDGQTFEYIFNAP